MTRSRVRERERLRRPVETSDPAGLAAYADELRPLVTEARTLADEATLPPAQRTHSRVYLRRRALKVLRELAARVDAATPQPTP